MVRHSFLPFRQFAPTGASRLITRLLNAAERGDAPAARLGAQLSASGMRQGHRRWVHCGRSGESVVSTCGLDVEPDSAAVGQLGVEARTH